MRYQYATNCTSADADSIQAMVEESHEISWRACWKNVDRREVHEMLGYTGSLTLEKDWAVPKPRRSQFRGRRCIFIEWSAIEYIFVEA